MSDVFFEGLGISGVDKVLRVGSGNHGEKTGKMLIANPIIAVFTSILFGLGTHLLCFLFIRQNANHKWFESFRALPVIDLVVGKKIKPL